MYAVALIGTSLVLSLLTRSNIYLFNVPPIKNLFNSDKSFAFNDVVEKQWCNKEQRIHLLPFSRMTNSGKETKQTKNRIQRNLFYSYFQWSQEYHTLIFFFFFRERAPDLISTPRPQKIATFEGEDEELKRENFQEQLQ